MPHPTQRLHRKITNDLAWRHAIQYALDEVHGEPRNPIHARPTLRVLNISESGCDIEVELRFHTGLFYPCCEPGDYFSLTERAWWNRLRTHLADVTDRIPPPLSLAIRGVIEKDAMFCVHRAFGLPLESPAFTYYEPRRCERDARDFRLP